MIKEYFFTGKTTDAAIEAGLKELGLDRDSVSVEIVEMPTSKLLGLVKTEAKIKISVEVEDKKVTPPKVAAPVPAAPMEKKAAPRPKKIESAKSAAPKKEVKPQALKENIAKKEQPVKEVPKREEKPEKIVDAALLEQGAADGLAFLKEILGILDINSAVSSDASNNMVSYTIDGEGMGLIIGRRGETLDALQYLTSLAVNKGKEDYIKVSLDTENYREKREKALIGLADKVSRRVLKTKKNVSLEPMNPYERRIIHSALQDIPNITTKSIGSEPNRKVVVIYEK